MRRLLSVSFIAVIGAYRTLLSPFLPRCCRFHPSCSEYAIEAIEKFGPWRGLLRSILRICRCHPWHPGGVDPVG